MMKISKSLEVHMKRKQANFPVHDYSPALEGALSWLGDRHLLAEPAPRLRTQENPYFTEPRRWHPSIVAGALAKTGRQD
jgi:hypothetical protein